MVTVDDLVWFWLVVWCLVGVGCGCLWVACGGLLWVCLWGVCGCLTYAVAGSGMCILLLLVCLFGN